MGEKKNSAEQKALLRESEQPAFRQFPVLTLYVMPHFQKK